jgi:uncharacterized UBP type Zn finger protein
MKNLLVHIWSGKQQIPFSPSSLLMAIQQKGMKYQFGNEEDAHWFLQILLQTMDEEISNELNIENSLLQLFETKKTRNFLCENCDRINNSFNEKAISKFLILILTLIFEFSKYITNSTR